MDRETWRLVPGFCDYEVSDAGRVRRASDGHCVVRGHLMTLVRSRRGYWSALLRDSGKQRRRVLVHRMVAAAFIGDVAGRVVHHVDGDPANNTVGNLRLLDNRCEHCQLHSELPTMWGERNHKAALTADAVREIRRMRGKCSQQALADRYSVNQTTISRVQLGQTWYHVDRALTPRR